MKIKSALIAALLALSGCNHVVDFSGRDTPAYDERARTYHSEVEQIHVAKGTRPDMRSCVYVSEQEPCARVTHYSGSAIENTLSPFRADVSVSASELEHSDGRKEYNLYMVCTGCIKDSPLKITLNNKIYVIDYDPSFFKDGNSFSEQMKWTATPEQAEELVKAIPLSTKLKISGIKHYRKKPFSISGLISKSSPN